MYGIIDLIQSNYFKGFSSIIGGIIISLFTYVTFMLNYQNEIRKQKVYLNFLSYNHSKKLGRKFIEYNDSIEIAKMNGIIEDRNKRRYSFYTIFVMSIINIVSYWNVIDWYFLIPFQIIFSYIVVNVLYWIPTTLIYLFNRKEMEDNLRT